MRSVASPARRLRGLLALEVRRVVEDLLRRQDLLVELWGRHRVRTPFLDTTYARYRTLTMTELLRLDADEVEALEGFYRELDDLRFYLAYTEDMPRTVAVVLDCSLARLIPAATAVLRAMGQDGIEDDAPPPVWEVEPTPPFGRRSNEE